MKKWADCSFARPDPATLVADGIVGVLRYLAPDDNLNSGKILRPAERDLLFRAGLDVCLNWEWYSGRCLDGYAAGVQDAAAAEAQALALGYPAGKTIYFSHDTSTFNQSVLDYFRGVRDRLRTYKPGAYGSYTAVTQLRAAGLVSYTWQTLAWSNGLRDPYSVIYQDGAQLLGGQVDVDEVTSTDIGSWLDGPTSGPTEDWFDMATEADLETAVDKKLRELLPWYLVRAVGLLRTGKANLEFSEGNAGALVDNVGLDGEIAKLSTGSVDYDRLASAVADELAKRMAS